MRTSSPSLPTEQTQAAHCVHTLSELGCKVIARVQEESDAWDLAFITALGGHLLIRCCSEISPHHLTALSTICAQRTFDRVVLIHGKPRADIGLIAFEVLSHSQFQAQAAALAATHAGQVR